MLTEITTPQKNMVHVPAFDEMNEKSMENKATEQLYRDECVIDRHEKYQSDID